jgi:hypothetical protein
MKKLLLILLCLPIVVCASFPIPSVDKALFADTLLNTKTITTESSDRLQSDSTINSGWITGQEPEKYSKDWVIGKGKKKNFWRTIWRSHLSLWILSSRMVLFVLIVIGVILLWAIENGVWINW